VDRDWNRQEEYVCIQNIRREHKYPLLFQHRHTDLGIAKRLGILESNKRDSLPFLEIKIECGIMR
jgi:hypothetical protein